MTLTDVAADVAARMPTDHPTVLGPPFTRPPAAPCYIVELPQPTDVVGTSAGCRVTQATVDIVCIPSASTNADQLLAMADQVIAAFGSAVTSGQPEPSPFTDVDDVWTYRLTVEV